MLQGRLSTDLEDKVCSHRAQKLANDSGRTVYKTFEGTQHSYQRWTRLGTVASITFVARVAKLKENLLVPAERDTTDGTKADLTGNVDG